MNGYLVVYRVRFPDGLAIGDVEMSQSPLASRRLLAESRGMILERAADQWPSTLKPTSVVILNVLPLGFPVG